MDHSSKNSSPSTHNVMPVDTTAHLLNERSRVLNSLLAEVSNNDDCFTDLLSESPVSWKRRQRNETPLSTLLMTSMKRSTSRPLSIMELAARAKASGYNTSSSDFAHSVYCMLVKLKCDGLVKCSDQTRDKWSLTRSGMALVESTKSTQ